MIPGAAASASGAIGTLLVAMQASACGPAGAPPVLGALSDQIVAVNRELVIVLTATDPDGDALTYSFAAMPTDIQRRAALDHRDSGAAEFRWTPLAEDLGVWPFTFSVTDGNYTRSATIDVDVRSAVGSAPVFVHPQGAGTTLDLASRDCLALAVEVTDADTAEVDLYLGEPIVEGADLAQDSGTTAQLNWCPSAAQIAADDQYPMLLVADDRDQPPVTHPYLIVLRGASP